MSSKSVGHEPGFGSDSFLDVLANMVGILIILVVVAGIRIGRAPLASLPTPSSTTEAAPAEPEPASAEPEPEPAVAVEEPAPSPPESPPAEPERPRELGPDIAPREIAAELDAIRTEMLSINSKETARETKLRQLQAAEDAARQELGALEQSAVKETNTLEKQKVRLARLQESLGERKQALTALLAEFEEAQNARAPVTEVKVRLTPVSKEVTGKEVFFQLQGNRVSVIPMEELIERAKGEAERRKHWLARHDRAQGSVGPVDGFTLNYVIETHFPTPLEQRQLGPNVIRFSISTWQLVPETDLPSETAAQALARGSKFALALRTAPENATLTFWVYPDSFQLYRTLREAAYAEGFVVAGRPLLEGMRIGGSPEGSRSAGQ